MFISFEGTEGVGKSTLIATLHQKLTALSHDVVLTREPGGTPLAEQIRQVLLTPTTEVMTVETELLLIYAARAQHIAQVIQPALNANKMVLCDRFVDASIAYQHGGRGMSLDQIQILNQHFVHVEPELTFWLDAPVDIGMQRAKNRGALDRFEQEKKNFFEKIRQIYVQLHQQYPSRIIRLDAMQDATTIAEQAWQQIQTKYQF